MPLFTILLLLPGLQIKSEVQKGHNPIPQSLKSVYQSGTNWTECQSHMYFLLSSSLSICGNDSEKFIKAL